MKKRILLLLSFVFLLVLAVMPAAAQEILIPPVGGVFTNPDWLLIDFHRVSVTIENQVATTNVDLQFTNIGEGAFAEGTFLFPLPEGATVDRLTMYIDGVAYNAKILEAGEARAIYDEIVRQYRDPALLEYVGQSTIQANVFPIPAGASRRIQIEYSSVLEVDNGLVQYVYPLNPDKRVDDLSVSVQVTSNDPISSIYSPSHNISIVREGETSFRVGYESAGVSPGNDFTLYYGIASDTINLNLLTFRESANQDGFFMLLVQPPFEAPQDTIVPKDVILVIDQSGSMDGEKWNQAKLATQYMLENLQPADRFNVVVFSTGTRVYSNEILPASEAQGAIDWVNGLFAEGGTNINDSLSTALDMVGERPTTIMFMTDGEATEGTIETDAILANLQAKAKPNVRIFTFGVGDDINTLLLDSIARDFHGTGAYVRPTQRIDEVVASLFNKINAPVLTNVTLNFEGVTAELMYPQQVSDLFLGEQLTIVGRFRSGAEGANITIRGEVNGQPQEFHYDNLTFRDLAGGEPFIARLWATRRIGDLMNTIRLNGENQELIDSIVTLSVRYGIITPYTSFLIEEDDILSQQGRERALGAAQEEFGAFDDTSTGAAAVDRAANMGEMAEAEAPAPMLLATPTMGAMMGGGGDMGGGPGTTSTDEQDGDGAPDLGYDSGINPIQAVGDKTFIQLEGVWTDTLFQPDTMETQKVVFLSDEYFALLDEKPELAEYFAIGDKVIVVIEDVAYEVVAE